MQIELGSYPIGAKMDLMEAVEERRFGRRDISWKAVISLFLSVSFLRRIVEADNSASEDPRIGWAMSGARHSTRISFLTTLKLGRGSLHHVDSCSLESEMASSQISFSLWQAAANSKWIAFVESRKEHGSIA